MAPPTPDPPSSGGGGGPSGPSGPNGLCAHPFIEGMWVDCDAVICREDFVADENGECVPDCGENMVLDANGNCVLDCGPEMVPDGDGDCVADLANVLTSVGKGNVNNPYDGMQAYDEKGVIYTYDTELDSWLMPEVSNVVQSDNFEILTPPVPPYESAIVMTMTPIALGEPSFVGEIVLAGTFVIVGTIYLYDMAEYLRNVTDSDREHCINMFTLCNTTFAYKNMDCSTLHTILQQSRILGLREVST